MITKSFKVFSNLKVNNLKLYSNRQLLSRNNYININGDEGGNGITPILITVEGNIGAGKTTILNQLRTRNPEWTFIDEPVDIWTSLKTDNNESLLEVFYKDRKRWSYTFQNCALLTRYQMIESAISEFEEKSLKLGKHVFLTERCLDTDHQVFTKMLRAEGSIDRLELELYEKLLVHLKKSATPVSAIIHVDTNPTICLERIKIRSRNGEDSIPLEYLESLDNYQSKWVDSVDIPVYKTSENANIKEVEAFISERLLENVSTM